MTTTATCNTPNTMKIKYTLYTVYSNYRYTYKLIFDYANVSLEIPQYLCYSLQGLKVYLHLQLKNALNFSLQETNSLLRLIKNIHYSRGTSPMGHLCPRDNFMQGTLSSVPRVSPEWRFYCTCTFHYRHELYGEEMRVTIITGLSIRASSQPIKTAG